MERIEIEKSLIPYDFNIVLGDEQFTFAVDYNYNKDLFTVALYKGEEMVCAGEPIIYGVKLFKDCYMVGRFPSEDIIPLDESGTENTVTWENFNERVFLTIMDEGGEDDA